MKYKARPIKEHLLMKHLNLWLNLINTIRAQRMSKAENFLWENDSMFAFMWSSPNVYPIITWSVYQLGSKNHSKILVDDKIHAHSARQYSKILAFWAKWGGPMTWTVGGMGCKNVLCATNQRLLTVHFAYINSVKSKRRMQKENQLWNYILCSCTCSYWGSR